MTKQQPPLTRLTLIGALREGLRWEEFVALYGRCILLWGRQDFGLQESDAENLRQEVLIRVWKGVAGYDPARGRFRDWLYVCTRNAVCDLRRVEPREGTGHADDLLDRLHVRSPAAAWPEADSLEQAVRLLEEDGFVWQGLQAAVRQVRARVRPTTWTAFLLFEFFDLTAKEIGPRLGMQPTAVNQAVYRVRHLLQQALAGSSPVSSAARQEGP
jgi:RNA polymerase sigma-70 factor (ECF subfamily)